MSDRSPRQEVERGLERLLRRGVPAARLWTEHRPGLRSRCEKCGGEGRAWVGRYRQALARLLGYFVCASGPRCAWCVVQTERLERHLGVDRPHDWRDGMAVQT